MNGHDTVTKKIRKEGSRKILVEIFDKFTDKNIVREGGQIRKCLDEYYENVVISDELRKVLLLEESENYDIYSDKERNEFIFRLFKHVAIGGEVCQYEDIIQPYIDVTKSIYKDLIRYEFFLNAQIMWLKFSTHFYYLLFLKLFLILKISYF